MTDKPVVLLVDDVQSNILVLAEAISTECEVLFANSGPEALMIVEETVPDLVILDVMMPNMDGYEVCKRLQENPRLDGVPVIFLSALGEETDEARGLKAGAVDYLMKPANPDLVRARVRNHLRLRQTLQNQRAITAELREALERIKQLQGLLPICAWCKRVRSDQGYWIQLETYVSRYSSVTWNHGMCPECRSRLEKDEGFGEK